MEIGNGIAIAGVWIFVGMVGISKTTTSFGLYVGMFVGMLVTTYLK